MINSTHSSGFKLGFDLPIIDKSKNIVMPIRKVIGEEKINKLEEISKSTEVIIFIINKNMPKKIDGCVHLIMKNGKMINVFMHLNKLPKNGVVHLKGDKIYTYNEFKKSHTHDHE